MNTLFKSLYDAVVVNTNRPNLRAEIQNAIVSATKELHNRGKFRMDVREVLLTSTNGGNFIYKFSIPLDRGIREILAVHPIAPTGLKGISLPLVPLFAESTPPNYYSWNSNTLTIQLTHFANTFSLSFLSFPNTNLNEYDSWIAQRYPHFITDLATFKVLSMIGMEKQGALYRQQVGEARIPGTHIFNLLQENECLD